MQLKEQFVEGQLLQVVPWICEGIENPWGFDVNILDEITQSQSMSSSAFRARIRKPSARIPLKDGDVAVVVGHINMRHPHIDPFYVVLVNGRKTGIFSMFLKSMDRS